MEYKCKQDSDTGAYCVSIRFAFITLKFKTWRERLRLFSTPEELCCAVLPTASPFPPLLPTVSISTIFPADSIHDLVLYVQKVFECGFTSSTRLQATVPFLAEERIGPCQDLVNKDIAVGFKPARSPGNANSQKGKRPQNKFGGQRQDDRAVKPCLR